MSDDPDTFSRCVLDWSEWDKHAEAVALHRAFLALLRNDPVLAEQGVQGLDGAVLEQGAVLLRFGQGCDVRVLLVNWGRDLRRASLPKRFSRHLVGNCYGQARIPRLAAVARRHQRPMEHGRRRPTQSF